MPHHLPSEYIALFLPSLSGGGAQRVMVTFANELALLGLRVDLVLGSASGPYRSEISPAVSVIELGSPRVSRCLLPLAKYLRKQQPTWLFSTMLHANIIALISHYLSGAMTRVWVRESNTLSELLANRGPLSAWAYRTALGFAYRSADGVLAPSQGVADDLCRVLGLDLRSRIHVLMNPVAVLEIEELARKPLPEFDETIAAPWIVGCGRLEPQKDFDTLLRAFAQLPMGSGAQPSLILLGEGPERERLKRLSIELGIEERCHLPGFVSNPFAIFARASAFVLSSRFEGCPNVLLQAMACGTRVVSTDCPSGPREILLQAAHGLLVPVGDAPALARAIARQLEEPGDPQVIRARAGDFAAPAVAQKLLQLFKAQVT